MAPSDTTLAGAPLILKHIKSSTRHDCRHYLTALSTVAHFDPVNGSAGAEERAGEESVIIASRRQPVKSLEITAISHTGRRRREEPALTDVTRRRCQRPRRRTCSHGLPLIKEACCRIVLSICTRRIHSPCCSVPGKNGFARSAQRSLFIFHLLFTPTFSLSLSLSRPFPFIFLTFVPFFFKDIFNVSEAVGYLVNWLKLAARRFGQKVRAPAPGWERNHSHVKPREGFQLCCGAKSSKDVVCCFVVWG